MIRFKKLAASVAALTTALSLSVGTLAVTANEAKKAIDSKPAYTLAEKQFISSYEKEGVSDVAEFFIKNNYSVSDAKKVMRLYLKGKQLDKTRDGEGSSHEFYREDNLSTKQHYGIIIADNGITNTGSDHMHLTYNATDNTVSLSPSMSVHNITNKTSFQAVGYNDKSIFGSVSGTTTTGEPVGVCDFPFGIISNYTNEKAVHDQFGFNPHSYGGCTGTSYIYHTYVRGDFNHDGKVDVRDLSNVVDYNLHSGSENYIPHIYSDMNTSKKIKIAKAINKIAGDVNGDGSIDLVEVNWLTDITNREDVINVNP